MKKNKINARKKIAKAIEGKILIQIPDPTDREIISNIAKQNHQLRKPWIESLIYAEIQKFKINQNQQKEN